MKCICSGSKGNAYALVAQNEILLLECGMPLKEVKRAIDYQFIKIKGCIVSHGHKDHIKYVKEYLTAGIPVYTNDETQDTVEITTGERLYGMPEKIPFHIAGFKIIPFYVPHNDTPNFSYLIEHEEMGRLLFATDYEYLPWTFKQWGIQHFLIECNYDMKFVEPDTPNYEHVLRGHASLPVCLSIVDRNKAPSLQNVIMCHLSSSSGSIEYFTEEMRKVSGRSVKVCCASPGLSVELSKEPF